MARLRPIYERGCIIFQPAFEWIQEAVCSLLYFVFNYFSPESYMLQVKKYLPEEYERLEAYAEILPSSNRSPAHPWCGWVVNLNVMTRLHRDNRDTGYCLDGVISDPKFVGGELGLVQPGIVLPLLNGDFTIFPSMHIDHFNLHYQGQRCSFVFQTDKEFASWKENRHGWKQNKFIT